MVIKKGYKKGYNSKKLHVTFSNYMSIPLFTKKINYI